MNLADPQAPSVVSTFSFQGQNRAPVSSTARLSWRLRTSRGCPGSTPPARRPGSEKAATVANRALIESSKASDWLPSKTVTTGRGKSARRLPGRRL